MAAVRLGCVRIGKRQLGAVDAHVLGVLTDKDHTALDARADDVRLEHTPALHLPSDDLHRGLLNLPRLQTNEGIEKEWGTTRLVGGEIGRRAKGYVDDARSRARRAADMVQW